MLVTGDNSFAQRMWPTVRDAINFVLDLQLTGGEICWARSPSGPLPEALLTGSASIYHSLRCAVALANHLDEPQPEWELSLGRLGHAITDHPESFTEKPHHSMDWYYPIIGGALRGAAAETRIEDRWDDFVVAGLGIRCVDDRPWVTGAETCELVLALESMGDTDRALEQFSNMQHLRERDGSYWTGLVYSDGKRWPVERTTWTGAAVILAADALSSATGGHCGLPWYRPAPRSGGRVRLRMRDRRALTRAQIASPASPIVRRSTRSVPVADTSSNFPLSSARR